MPNRSHERSAFGAIADLATNKFVLCAPAINTLAHYVARSSPTCTRCKAPIDATFEEHCRADRTPAPPAAALMATPSIPTETSELSPLSITPPGVPSTTPGRRQGVVAFSSAIRDGAAALVVSDEAHTPAQRDELVIRHQLLSVDGHRSELICKRDRTFNRLITSLMTGSHLQTV